MRFKFYRYLGHWGLSLYIAFLPVLKDFAVHVPCAGITRIRFRPAIGRELGLISAFLVKAPQ